MRSLLLQLDGKGPNLALMTLAAFLRGHGDEVELRRVSTPAGVERGFWDGHDRVYASAIFEWTRPIVRRLLEVRPDAIVGGSGWDENAKLSQLGVPDATAPDYSDYPTYPHSIGFTQRGCRLACSFCKVPRMEGRVREAGSVWNIWRGEPWPRNLLLLDNDFFGAPSWRQRIDEINTGKFKVCWNQGFNVRLINDEEAAAIASTNYKSDDFKRPMLYTAFDNAQDEGRLFRNLESLVRYGVSPDEITVYMLIGYDHATKQPLPRLTESDFHRHRRLREFGCRPFPMPYVRPPHKGCWCPKCSPLRELVGFQRWIVRRADLKVSWEEYKSVECRPERLQGNAIPPLFVEAL